MVSNTSSVTGGTAYTSAMVEQSASIASQQAAHPLWNKFIVAASTVSGDPLQAEAFLNKKSMLYVPVGRLG